MEDLIDGLICPETGNEEVPGENITEDDTDTASSGDESEADEDSDIEEETDEEVAARVNAASLLTIFSGHVCR